jgi:hypothetical protein
VGPVASLDAVVKTSQPLSGLEPPIIQPIAQFYTTELFWLTSQICLSDNECTKSDKKIDTGLRKNEGVKTRSYNHIRFNA